MCKDRVVVIGWVLADEAQVAKDNCKLGVASSINEAYQILNTIHIEEMAPRGIFQFDVYVDGLFHETHIAAKDMSALRQTLKKIFCSDNFNLSEQHPTSAVPRGTASN